MDIKKVLDWLLPLVYLIILGMEFKVEGYGLLKIIVNVFFITLLIITRFYGKGKKDVTSSLLIKIMVIIGILLSIVYLIWYFAIGKNVLN